jgi:hypothetical protein
MMVTDDENAARGAWFLSTFFNGTPASSDISIDCWKNSTSSPQSKWNNYRNSGSILVIHDMGNGFALKCPAGTQNMLRRIEVSNKWHGCSLTLAGSGRLDVNTLASSRDNYGMILYSNEKECRLTVNKNTSVRVGGSVQAVSVQISPDQAGDTPPVNLLGSLRAYSDSSERLVGEFFEGGSELETEYHGYPENNTLGNWVYTLIEDTYTAFIPATYVEFR